MKLEGIESWRARIPLSRPYEIAYERVDSIELFFVRVRCAGQIGLGCASPLPEVTGESFAACGAALEPGALAELGDANLDDFPALLARIENSHRDTPAARAALDMALHDLRSRLADRPLVEMLGRVHSELATSITIGLKDSVAEVLAEAEEYVGRGFRLIKLKTGRELTQDIERMRRLRERFGASIRLRIDANVGCKPSELAALFSVADELDVELVEHLRSACEPNAQGCTPCFGAGPADPVRRAYPPEPPQMDPPEVGARDGGLAALDAATAPADVVTPTLEPSPRSSAGGGCTTTLGLPALPFAWLPVAALLAARRARRSR